MYAPKGIDESIESFCKKADVFKSFQVKVPEIYFRNDDLCHLIIEDFSDNLFQLNITQENSDVFIKSALDQLIRIQNIDSDIEIFDRFDLEKSIEYYTRGSHLKSHCQKKLDEAVLKLDEIKVSPDGKISKKK